MLYTKYVQAMYTACQVNFQVPIITAQHLRIALVQIAFKLALHVPSN